MNTAVYFLLQTLLACACLAFGTQGDALMHSFFFGLGFFILGHLATEALNYNETQQTKSTQGD